MENKYKKSLLLVLAIVLTLATVSATVTFLTPLDDGTIGATTTNSTLNVSFSTVIGQDVLVNCSFYIRSAGLTENTTWWWLQNTTNSTIADAGNVNSSIAAYTNLTMFIDDGNDYILNASCLTANNTFIGDTTITGITLDITIPDIPTSLSPVGGTVDTDGDVTFSATVGRQNTTACTLFFPETNPGSSQYTMTHLEDSCSRTITGIAEGTYKNWYILATDGTNSTNATRIADVIVSTSTPQAGALVLGKKTGSTGRKLLSIGFGDREGNIAGIPPLVWVLLIGGVLGLILRKRFKR